MTACSRALYHFSYFQYEKSELASKGHKETYHFSSLIYFIPISLKIILQINALTLTFLYFLLQQQY